MSVSRKMSWDELAKENTELKAKLNQLREQVRELENELKEERDFKNWVEMQPPLTPEQIEETRCVLHDALISNLNSQLTAAKEALEISVTEMELWYSLDECDCEDIPHMCGKERLKKSIKTATEALKKLGGDDHHCWADPDNVDHCGHCGRYFLEKEVCLDCGGWGMIHENVDCPAIGTFNECACSVPCPSCNPKSTHHHADPATKGVEKRTLGED